MSVAETKVVLVLLTVTCLVSSQKLQETCDSHAVCPSGSSCRPKGCDGYVCLCDEGFIPNHNYTRCVRGSFIGQQCDGVSSSCVSLFSQCNGGKCECLFIARQTKTSRPFCSTGNAVSEPCTTDFDCSDRFAVCTNKTCVCDSGFRLQTDAEFWVNPFEECIEENIAPEKCGSSDVVVPSLLVSVSSSAVEASSSVDIPETSLVLTPFESSSGYLSTDYVTAIDATSVMIASSPAVSSTEVIFSDQSTSIDSASSVEPTQSLLSASMSLTGSDVVPTPSSTIASSSVIPQTVATGIISDEFTISPTPSSTEVLSSAPHSDTAVILSSNPTTDSSQILLETSSVSVDGIVSSSQIATDQIVSSSPVESSHTPVYSSNLDNPGLLTSNSPQASDAVTASQSVVSSAVDASISSVDLQLSTSGIDLMSSSPSSSSAPQDSTPSLDSSITPTDTTAVLYSVSSIDASYNLATSTEVLGASSLTDSSTALIRVDTSGSSPSASLNVGDTTIPISAIAAVQTTGVVESSSAMATPTTTLVAATTVLVTPNAVTTTVVASGSASADVNISTVGVVASSSVAPTSTVGVAVTSSIAPTSTAGVAATSSVAVTSTVGVVATSSVAATSTVGVVATSSVAATSTVGVVVTSSIAPTSPVNVAASSSVIVSSSPTTKTVIIPTSNDTLSQERPEILILVGTLAAILFISIVVILVVVACKFDAFGKRRRRSSLSAETSSLSSSGKLTIPRPFIKMTTPGYLNAVSTWNSRVSYNDMPLHYSNAGYRSEA